MATQGRSASASASMTAAVNTPLTRLAAATSRANRARNPGSSASSIRIVLTATSRPAVERARNTCPIAPAPSFPMIAYGPIRSGSQRRSGCTIVCATVGALPQGKMTPTICHIRRHHGQRTRVIAAQLHNIDDVRKRVTPAAERPCYCARAARCRRSSARASEFL